MKAKYWQRGESLDYLNNTEDTIEATTVVALGNLVGVVGTDIPAGEMGSVIIAGVFEMEKTGTEAITQGAQVYFDGAGITGAADDGASSGAVAYTPAGYAAQAADADDTTILVKLLG